jgi:hypothetical protein
MKHKAARLGDMPGMWRRALIIHADGSRDFTTQVRWLQSHSLFVDLRQGAALPDFLHLRCLNDLTPQDCTELAGQEGFAGRFGVDGECFEWQRWIDFQPVGRADAGRLWWEEEILVEAGRDVPYIEHWMRDPTVVTRPLAAVRLRDLQTGVAALAVQVGTVFMFARDRAQALPPLATLAECVAGAASLAQARAMLDCEITLGSVGFGASARSGAAAVNLILASTHPWRVSANFALTCSDKSARTLDIDCAGQCVTRHWEVIEAEGDPAAVWPDS